jgi:dienelactone hydrolase
MLYQQIPGGEHGMHSTLHYVQFASLHETPLRIGARLRVPATGQSKSPAVLILHGSAGPSGREGGYAERLNEAGIVTLEPDQWSARGLRGGAEGRPRTIVETLPDVFGAKNFLATHPNVDAAHIGVMGFSFGGVASMLSATRAHSDRDGAFAAYMPHYPICFAYNALPGFEFSSLVTAPIFIVTGALDQYDNDPEALPKLVASLSPPDRANIRFRVIPDAHHGFDMPGVDMVVQDPAGNRGKGGDVIMRHNPAATSISHTLAVDFFTQALGAA